MNAISKYDIFVFHFFTSIYLVFFLYIVLNIICFLFLNGFIIFNCCKSSFIFFLTYFKKVSGIIIGDSVCTRGSFVFQIRHLICEKMKYFNLVKR